MPKAQAKRRFKRRYAVDIAAAVVGGGLIVFGLWYNANRPQPLCKEAGKEYQVTVQNDAFSTERLFVSRCDVIKIINLDTQNYLFAFGVHEKHIDYPGFSETLVRPNEFIAVDALQAGDFRIHDHLRDKAAIELTIVAVKPN